MNTTDPPTYLKATLEQRPLSPNFSAAIGDAFRVTSLRGHPYYHTPLGGNATCDKPNNGIYFIQYQTCILDLQVSGYESICLLGITESAQAILLYWIQASL